MRGVRTYIPVGTLVRVCFELPASHTIVDKCPVVLVVIHPAPAKASENDRDFHGVHLSPPVKYLGFPVGMYAPGWPSHNIRRPARIRLVLHQDRAQKLVTRDLSTASDFSLSTRT